MIEWAQQSDNEGNIRGEVNFQDSTVEVFEKGAKLRQVWHEDAV